jgi:hypothetical protein
MSAAIVCLNPAEYIPAVSFYPIFVGGTENVLAPTVVDGVAFKTIAITGSSFNYSVSQIVPKFLDRWTMTSETPTICTVSGDTITRISNGTGIIRFTGLNGFFTISKIDFTTTGYTKFVWTGFSGVTKSSRLCDPVLSLLTPSKDKNYFSENYALGATTLQKNPNCWAAPLDVTGSAISTTLWGPNASANSGALITPQHWMGVLHWGVAGNMEPGSQVRFVGNDGVIHTRAVLRRYYQGDKDQIISLLDSPLPATVKPYKLAGLGMFDFVNKRGWGMGWQFTQDKYVTPVSFDNLRFPPQRGVVSTTIQWVPHFDEYGSGLDVDHRMYPVRHLLQTGRGGDSGGAVGGYYNGETFLVSLFTSPAAGSLYSASKKPELDAIIASLDAAQGISTGYTVGVLEIV